MASTITAAIRRTVFALILFGLAGQAAGEEYYFAIELNVVLANSLFHPHLVADFVTRNAERTTYRVFDGRENAVRETTYTRVGTEKLALAGRTFDTVVLEVAEQRTATAVTVWLDAVTGIIVQTRQPGNRRTYLTDRAVVRAVLEAGGRIDLDWLVLFKTNVSIQKVREISHMKIKAALRPQGLRLSPEALRGPGQRFEGTVKDNLVEGVFEIEHRRYDGRNAPPFPPDVGDDPALREYLRPDIYIQSDDRVIREKAREITSGARDSWDAMCRLSRWVATEIKGAIPGGITARGPYDQRAGECGGHSFLLAAFGRSVGIPVRAVWGLMYLPRDGGVFGRHAWNEVYMGEAGWIPIDATFAEADYVDSGHLRLGVIQSLSNEIDVKRIEILEHEAAQPNRSGSPARRE